MKNESLKERYQLLIDWNTYRLEQNTESLEKLLVLLPKLDKELEGDESYKSDIPDLHSLKVIYETGIRNFESTIDKYNSLLKDLS
ncbi:hypothetical protein [Dyadobacter sp. NIV53]|uniref:hypothetical protein n=1 Tax=Dyadobacter sp. NIV53 TaxID=2861765 RepID=UPI001C879EDF|nr:hypothetical protein [Dyadobacter sp. NIV53]